MVVKSAKDYHIIVAFLLFFNAAFFFLLLSAGSGILFPCIITFLLYFIVLRFWVSVGRTFIFEDSGCTVKFLFLEKHYSWGKLHTKQTVDYKNAFGYRVPYVAGAIFTTKPIKTPLRLKPAQYSFLFHPFCFCFVNFNPHIQYRKLDYKTPDVYLVEETEFLEKFSQYLQQ